MEEKEKIMVFVEEEKVRVGLYLREVKKGERRCRVM